MDLTRHVEELRHQLMAVAEPGGDDVREVAGTLAASLDSATRLVLLDALSSATDEITRELAPGSVELRLRGRDPEFVVSLPPSDPAGDQPVSPDVTATSAAPSVAVTDADDGSTSRITLRLPEQLKLQIEELAGRSGVSVNSWLVRTLTDSVEAPARPRPAPQRTTSGGQRFTGWAR